MKVEEDHELVEASLEEGLPEKPEPTPERRKREVRKFAFWVVVNVLATLGIVFVNKAIFQKPAFRHMQVSFASFHFACTAGTLLLTSRLGMFTPRRTTLLEMLPLSAAMCLNVILPNLSLAYSSVTVYQIARILLTPAVALIEFIFYQTTIPLQGVIMLTIVCVGVGLVSYYDTIPTNGTEERETSPIGVFFALAGVLASSIYTVWIGVYQKKLNMSTMQLLFNQAPLASVMLWVFVPFVDVTPELAAVEVPQWALICLSGFFASLINMSQFIIVTCVGPTTSTIIGHSKTCLIVFVAVILTQRPIHRLEALGVAMAVAGSSKYLNMRFKLMSSQQQQAPKA